MQKKTGKVRIFYELFQQPTNNWEEKAYLIYEYPITPDQNWLVFEFFEIP